MSKKSDKKAHKEKDKKALKNKGKSSKKQVSPEQRREMIATAAYYIAERHGFTPGNSDSDWAAAEKEIDHILGKKKKKKHKG